MTGFWALLAGSGMLLFVAWVAWAGLRHPEWRRGDDEAGDMSGWGTGR